MRWLGTSYDADRVYTSPGLPRVLVLTRYGRLGPTTRVRFLQFIDHFERAGGCELAFDIAPLLEDHSLQRLYADGTRSHSYLLMRYLRRVGQLLAVHRYDLLWVEKELFPGLPAWAERALAALGVKVVVDYDDAAYTWYREHPSWVVRAMLGNKIETVCRTAHTVITGNDTLANYARSAGASSVVTIPSVVDPSRYPDANTRPREDGQFVVGWIGTPSNVRYLELFRTALTGMSALPGFKFRTIGAPDGLFHGVPQEAHAWSEATEATLLASCDCTLAPLAEGELERGKCGYKVIQGMAAGLPVVASPVGMIRDLVRHGENGFFAETAEECHNVLNRLRVDPGLRRRVGINARETVERGFSTSATGSRLAELLRGAAGSPWLAPQVPAMAKGAGGRVEPA